MTRNKLILPFTLFTFLVLVTSYAYSAYGTIYKVDISAPSSPTVGQPTQIQATVYTSASGWGTCTVRDVRAVLLLPEGVNMTSDDSQKTIGDMAGDSSATVTWTVIFPENKTYTLNVQASGYDSDGVTCAASQSKTVVAGESSSQLPPEIYIVLIGGVVIAAAILVAVVLGRHRQTDKGRKF